MLTEEDDVEIHALARRGWSVSAIARHTGRDRKTVRKSLAGGRPVREPAPSCLEPFREYLPAALEAAERDKPGYTQFLHDLLATKSPRPSNAASQAGCGSPASRAPRRSSSSTSAPNRHWTAARRRPRHPALHRREGQRLADRPARRRQDNARHDRSATAPSRPATASTTPPPPTSSPAPPRPRIEGRWATTMRFWNGPQLLIVDELGYLPMPGEAAAHLFQVISRRYEHGSIVLTTNRDIADWGHDLRRHHRRRRHPRPPPAPRHRPLHQRRQLPHARPPRTPSTRSAPAITGGEFS